MSDATHTSLVLAPDAPDGTDLFAALVADLQAPIDAWLTAAGATPELVLTVPTREGAGDLALPCHKYSKALRKAPQVIATELAAVVGAHPLVAKVDAVAGFLNLHLHGAALAERAVGWALGDVGATGLSRALAGKKYVIEYSSPNTNKPQHLGHCRNNILGQSVATLLRAVGAEVVRVNLINDRGIHICKSMWAWQQFGEGATPESTGIKGDHLVGDYYVRFNTVFEAEYKARFEHTAEAESPEGGRPNKDVWFNTESPIGQQVRAMLLAWEAGDAEVRALWRTMNSWCEAGFAATYARMGVAFDRLDKESTTYLLGKDLVEKGLKNEVFRHADNGAVVYDLARIGLEGEKAVLRADGTSVYMTQDLGTAMARFEDFEFDRMVYVVGNEQEHHFSVLFGILSDLDARLKNRLYHLSYGMVELPEGKMKSREGTVVDADDLMDNLREEALAVGRENWPDLDEAELARRAEAIGLSGLKFYLMKFAPATTFTFDPKASIKPEGETGVYCQYAYARAGSILRKLEAALSEAAAADGAPVSAAGEAKADWSALEAPQARAVIAALLRFPGEVRAAATELKPSLLTKATYELARSFATFYNHPDCRVIGAEPGAREARAALVRAARRVLKSGLDLLGIEALEEM
jgi:arginyl-tRNA synthetase